MKRSTKTERVNIRLDQETRTMLDQLCEARGLTITDVLRDAIRREHAAVLGGGQRLAALDAADELRAAGVDVDALAQALAAKLKGGAK